jgi:phosphoribosylglycinamide formyltransferase 1
MRIAVFASGSGSNFEALAQAADSGSLDATIALCLTNRKDAGVLERARKFGIPGVVVSPTSFDNDALYESALSQILRLHRIDIIALAGYLKKIPVTVVSEFDGRIVNIHPALLPDFGGKGMYGMNVHRAVIDSGETESGATVHLVDSEYDTGRILSQERIPVLKSDTPEILAHRVLEVEHRLYAATLQQLIVHHQSQHDSR